MKRLRLDSREGAKAPRRKEAHAEGAEKKEEARRRAELADGACPGALRNLSGEALRARLVMRVRPAFSPRLPSVFSASA
jgi:hypothetical protein